MKKILTLILLLIFVFTSYAQQSPAITSWIQNKTVTGKYYIAGIATLIANNILVNCQKVAYNDNFAYVSCTGVPSYATGPFQDRNPSQASDQAGVFRFTLSPVKNTGTPTATQGGNIGLFINGVALFDYRDGVAWNNTTKALCGSPGNSPCPQGQTSAWNRDAIVAERAGFDCAKGHPAMGNYHHHQNPSAFKLDKQVLSTVCNLYDADGLYVIDSTKHSPLIGFAYDGFPIYGAYGFKNLDGTGGITRIKSAYSLRNLTTRVNGPDVNSTYPLGYWREDYEYIAQPTKTDVLDDHNGRFCITPEYPSGTYAYFCTVDANWNSAYPYVVGPTFYGVYSNAKTTSIPANAVVYEKITSSVKNENRFEWNVFPNPTSEFIAVQIDGIIKNSLKMELTNMAGQIVNSSTLNAGQTIAYIDIQSLYNGVYFLSLIDRQTKMTQKVVVKK